MSEGRPRSKDAPRFGFDDHGLGAAAVKEQLAAIARAEDEVWASGGCCDRFSKWICCHPWQDSMLYKPGWLVCGQGVC